MRIALLILLALLTLACNRDDGHISASTRDYLSSAATLDAQIVEAENRQHDAKTMAQIYRTSAIQWMGLTPPSSLRTAHDSVGRALHAAAANAPNELNGILGPALREWTSEVLGKYKTLPLVIVGLSMKPTLCSGNVVLFSAFDGALERWEIVAIRYLDSTPTLVKRVVGLPGDTIVISDGKLIINGTEVEHPYAEIPLNEHLSPVIVGEDHIFVLGDNLAHSLDSRNPELGTVPLRVVRGESPQQTKTCNAH